MTIGQYGDNPAPYGLQYEANLLGSYSGALCVMMLVMYLYDHRRRFLVGFALALAGMAISLSRGALGATFIGLLAVAIFSLKKKLLTRQLLLKIAQGTLCALLVVLPAVVPQYSERFNTMDIGEPAVDPNTLTRIVQVSSAFDEVLETSDVWAVAPPVFSWLLIGSRWERSGKIKAGSAIRKCAFCTIPASVGLVIFIAFLVSLYRRSRKVLKAESNPELVALLASALVYCISFQATEGTLLAFAWVHLGLIGCAISIFFASEKVYGKEALQGASG